MYTVCDPEMITDYTKGELLYVVIRYMIFTDILHVIFHHLHTYPQDVCWDSYRCKHLIGRYIKCINSFMVGTRSNKQSDIRIVQVINCRYMYSYSRTESELPHIPINY